MTEEPVPLESMSRQELIAKAKSLGVERPQVMTRVELKDEILRRTTQDEVARRQVRGWFGVARDLVASVVERGLHLPDAAGVLRGVPTRGASWAPPVATVTLAEIYASQGHRERAIAMLDEVLSREPEHEVARQLRDRLSLGSARPVDMDALGSPGTDSAMRSDGAETPTAAEVRARDVAAPAATPGRKEADGEATAPDSRISERGASSELTADTAGQHVTAVMKEWATALDADAVEGPQSDVHWVGEADYDPSKASTPQGMPPMTQSTAPTLQPGAGASVSKPSVQPLVPSLDVLFWRRAEDGVVALYWELCPESERRHLARDPLGKPVSRVAGAYVEGGTCHRFEREVELAGCFGSARVGSVPNGAQLRVALGWIGAGRFVPIALGLGIERHASAGEWWEHLVADPAQQAELGRARQRAAAAIG